MENVNTLPFDMLLNGDVVALVKTVKSDTAPTVGPALEETVIVQTMLKLIREGTVFVHDNAVAVVGGR